MNAGEWIFRFFRSHRGLPFRSMTVFNYLLEAALLGGLLVLLMLVVRRLVRRRIGSGVLWAAWLLVALRLLIPLTLPNPLMNELRPTWSYDTAARPVADQFRVRFQDAVIDLGHRLSPEGVVYFGQEDVGAEDVTAGNLLYNLGVYTSYGWMGKWFLIGYGVIAGGVALWMLVSNIIFRRRLHRDALRGLSPAMQAAYEQLCREWGVPAVPVDVVDSLPGPCLTGVFRPLIVLPSTMAEDDMLLALRHELCHLKARDHLWTVLRSLCCVVQWFNPLVWLGARISQDDCEMACDERVLRTMDEPEQARYAQALKQSAVRRSRPGLLICSTGMTFTSRRIEIRLRALRPCRPVRRGAATIFAAVAAATLLLSFFTDETVKPTLPPVSVNDQYAGMAGIDALSVAQVPSGYGLLPAMAVTDASSAATQAMRYLSSQCFYSAGYTHSDTAATVDWCAMPAPEGWYVSILQNPQDMTLMLLDNEGRLLRYDGDVLRQTPLPYGGVLPQNTDEAVLSHIQRFATGCMNIASVTDYRRTAVHTLGAYAVIVTAEATLDGVRYRFDMNLDSMRFWRVQQVELAASVQQTQAEVLTALQAWVEQILYGQGRVDSSQLLISMRWDETLQRLLGVIYVPAGACSEEAQAFLAKRFERSEAYLLHFPFDPLGTGYEAVTQQRIALSPEGVELNPAHTLPEWTTVYTLVDDRWLVKQEPLEQGTDYTVMDTMDVQAAGVVPVGAGRDTGMTRIAFRRTDGSVGCGWVKSAALTQGASPMITAAPDARDTLTIPYRGTEAAIAVFVKHRVYEHFSAHDQAALLPEQAVSAALETLHDQYGLSLEAMTVMPVEFGLVTDSALPYWQVDVMERDDPTLLYSVHVRDEDGVVIRVYGPQDGNG